MSVNKVISNPMSSDGRRNSSMPASQIHTQIQIGRSPVPVRLALKSYRLDYREYVYFAIKLEF